MDLHRVATRLLVACLLLGGLLAPATDQFSANSKLYPLQAVRIAYGSLRQEIRPGAGNGPAAINGPGAGNGPAAINGPAAGNGPAADATVAANFSSAFQPRTWMGIKPGPNYVRSLAGLQRWRQFPVSVSFRHDANYSLRRQEEAVAGFEQWVLASNGRVSFCLTSSPAAAQITVRFDPTRLRSETVTHYDVRRHILYHADVCIGMLVDDGTGSTVTPGDVQALAAHEFGHALGIDGHSGNPHDLMYPSLGNTNRAITVRDLNTLRRAYAPLSS